MALVSLAGPAAVATQPPSTPAPPAAAHVQGDATSWWLSTERTPARAPERSAGARVARKFIGQPARNLGRWLRRQPGFRCQKL